MFYTRLPCPSWVDHSEPSLNRATIYFPVIGWIAGTLSVAVWALVYVAAYQHELGIILSIFATIWLTGAFHEDGLADVCDAFGGGWTKARILEILKDSRLGTYGVIGLLLVLSIKFWSLKAIPIAWLPPVMILGHSMSRMLAATYIFALDYARENDLVGAKSKPVAKKLAPFEIVIMIIFGLLPVALLINPIVAIGTVIFLLPAWLYLYRLYKKCIQGYTGDCLGAAQQIFEICIYLYFAFHPWRFFA
jgi:adenosylcobinamide-GDP ribazoletransferase